ncbi:MAG: DUF1427 family protein [Burkholderia sp.]
MKPYLLSLCAGVLAGLIYSLIGVRSPAPPAIALVGLLGILVGEAAVPSGLAALQRVYGAPEPRMSVVMTKHCGTPAGPKRECSEEHTHGCERNHECPL